MVENRELVILRLYLAHTQGRNFAKTFDNYKT